MTFALRPAPPYRSWAHYCLVHHQPRAPIGIVNLHGLGGDLSQTHQYHGCRIGTSEVPTLYPDAREHGLSSAPTPADLSFELAADDVVDLVTALGLARRVVLIGVSMGAATALHIALQDLLPVAGLILIRPAWLNEPNPGNLAPFPIIAKLLHEQGPRLGAQTFQGTDAYRAIQATSDSAAQSLLAQFTRPGATQRKRRLVQMPTSVPFRDRQQLAELAVPTLVIEAPNDPVHPTAIARSLALDIPKAGWAATASRDADPHRHATVIRGTVDAFLKEL